MKCVKCNSEINKDNIKCPICGKEQNILNFTVSKLFLFAFLFIFFSPIIIGLIVGVAGIALSTKTISANDLIVIIKGIIYIIISIPLFLSILGWTGKIFKKSEKKSIICLVLAIISFVGLVCFNNFCKNFIIQFEEYNEQEYITLNNISVPTLYNTVGYNDVFLSFRYKITEEDITGEEIIIIANEKMSDDVLYRYKDVLIGNGYSYLGIIDKEVEAYVFFENNYYMIVGILNDNKAIMYLSLDRVNYNSFLDSVELDNIFKDD